MAGHDVNYERTKRERSRRDSRQNQRSCSRLAPSQASFNPLDGRERRQLRKNEKRTFTPRQSTTTAIPERQSTTITCHCQEKAITNCVLLSSNWSEFILRTNGVENIPHCRCEIHVYPKKGKCELTLLCILQWKAIPGLTWDFNAETIEKSISKCLQAAYNKALYKTYRRNFYS